MDLEDVAKAPVIDILADSTRAGAFKLSCDKPYGVCHENSPSTARTQCHKELDSSIRSARGLQGLRVDASGIVSARGVEEDNDTVLIEWEGPVSWKVDGLEGFGKSFLVGEGEVEVG